VNSLAAVIHKNIRTAAGSSEKFVFPWCRITSILSQSVVQANADGISSKGVFFHGKLNVKTIAATNKRHTYCCIICHWFLKQLRSCWYVYWLCGTRVGLKHMPIKGAWEASFRQLPPNTTLQTKFWYHSHVSHSSFSHVSLSNRNGSLRGKNTACWLLRCLNGSRNRLLWCGGVTTLTR